MSETSERKCGPYVWQPVFEKISLGWGAGSGKGRECWRQGYEVKRFSHCPLQSEKEAGRGCVSE